MTERTLSIVKPDAVAAGHLGEILAALEHSGLKIVAGKMKKLSTRKATSTGQILHPAAYCLLKSMQEGSLERETSTRERAAQVLEHFDE